MGMYVAGIKSKVDGTEPSITFDDFMRIFEERILPLKGLFSRDVIGYNDYVKRVIGVRTDLENKYNVECVWHSYSITSVSTKKKSSEDEYDSDNEEYSIEYDTGNDNIDDDTDLEYDDKDIQDEDITVNDEDEWN